MSSPAPPRLTGAVSATRQQLDELDALIERMLVLPVEPGQEESAAETADDLTAPPVQAPPVAEPAPAVAPVVTAQPRSAARSSGIAVGTSTSACSRTTSAT